MKFSKKILKFTIVCFIATSFLFGAVNVRPAHAAAVQTADEQGIMATIGQTGKDVASWAKNWALDKWEWIRDEGIALAYKKALGYFLNTLAKDTAVYIATGEKGQSPMFYTESWGDYLANVADNAAGHFLEELGSGGPVAFDLCDPGFDVTAQIGLGIADMENPDPDCTYTEMKKNWKSELARDDFLQRFTNMFEPQSNDFGIALSLQGEVMNRKIAEKEVATLNRNMNEGIKDVTETISGAIKTPGNIVREMMVQPIKDSSEKETTFTGHIVADAVDVFTSTLFSKLMEEWLKKGLARSSDDTSYTGDWGDFSGMGGGGGAGSSYSGGGGLSDYESSGSSGGGVSQAKKQFQTIVEPSFSVKGDYEALNELTACSDPVNSGPNECVMTDNERQAIELNLTLNQAIEDGYFNENAIFGFKADGIEPSYTEGIPYRSMIIMRKFRIIPVGWELAAQYIMQNQASLSGTISLRDMIECFYVPDPTDPNAPRDRYPGVEDAWCQGLVDPSWVLKSPQNFCKREGPGPHIISTQVSGVKEKSKYLVNRDSSYCADEQTCIKESDDGACEVYGYCTEDRRKYNFGGESCDANFNSCQAFRTEDGRTMSLLKNTLDYSGCNIENAGCEAYKQSEGVVTNDYDPLDDKVDWEVASGSIKLDASALDCEVEAEGCHEFIRTKPGLGINLLSNSSFEDYIDATSGFREWGNIGSLTTDSREGFTAVVLDSPINRDLVIDPVDITVPPTPFDLEGNIFTLSAYAKGCGSGAELQLSGSSDFETVSLETFDWKLVSLTLSFDAPNGNTLNISTNGANDCTIDAIKLERTTPEADGNPTRYVPYRGVGLVYQKLLPYYMFDECYVDEDEAGNTDGYFELASSSPASCVDFARPCTEREVNCEMYVSKSDDFTVPAVVQATDYCPAECVGYDAYLQTESYFEEQEEEYFIPDTAEVCTAQAAGCDEFTNVDETNGSENREYFINIRQCVLPTEPTCEPFFMWEGSDETGYQLKVHRLDTVGSDIRRTAPASNCSIDILDELNYDADCREFYDETGGSYFELYYNTVSCTDNCHPYRRTTNEGSLLAGLSPAVECGNHGGAWNGTACVYMAVPDEGEICDAEEAGCREYNGNTGANTRTILSQSFENGTNMGWINGENTNASVVAGEHSLGFDSVSRGDIIFEIGGEIREGKSYVLEFLAAGTSLTDIYLTNDIASMNPLDRSNFDITGLTIETDVWHSYEVNIDNLAHEVFIESEVLVISGVGYIDNIRLIEVTDRHYLIEESWEDTCEYENADPFATPPVVNEARYAGCDIYTDRDRVVHNLYQFDHLCPESAVGCELMIDTHNYSDYQEKVWNDGDDDGVCDPTNALDLDCELIPADSYVYAVYDSKKTCNAQEKGCERMGLEYKYEYSSSTNMHIQYFNNYKINNPNEYNTSLCTDDAVRCDAWESRNGNAYFKDPNDMICEWRVEQDYGLGQYDWLKKKVKKCDEGDADGEINSYLDLGYELDLCVDSSECGLVDATMVASSVPAWCEMDSDCPASSECVENECRYGCILDEHDWYCDIDNEGAYVPKTYGKGGAGAMIFQPLGSLEGSLYAGACPTSEDDCTEYIDSISDFSPEVDVLKQHTLYKYNSGSLVDIAGDYHVFDYATNMLGTSSMIIAPGDLLYYYGEDYIFNPEVTGLIIREVVVDYQLAYSLDKGSCNGMVDLEQGCMLFDERSIDVDNQYTELISSAFPDRYSVPTSPEDATMIIRADSPVNDSNVLLKIVPDRECNEWLSCKSFIKDAEGNDVCFDVGQCSRLDDSGNCSYFSDSAIVKINQTVSTVDITNKTGYSKVGYDTGYKLRSDYYSLGDMTQAGQVSKVPNGGFELYDDQKYPIGWVNPNVDWESDMFRVINNPVEAQKEGVDYPMDGNAFLKFGARDSVQSELIELAPDSEYILSFHMNTKNLAVGSGQLSASFLPSTMTMKASLDWKFFVVHFTTNAAVSDRITLETIADGGFRDGNVYVDKIEIKPALNSRAEGGNEWYTPQTCRLYPETDSLSCEYYDDSGHKKKGWPGYCLEYDRYPGNPDACLMWYPVDRVHGDGFEEGGGYLDRVPLYYCTAVTDLVYNVEWYNSDPPSSAPTSIETFAIENNFGVESSGDMDITHRNPTGYSEDAWTLDQLGLSEVEEASLKWENISHVRVHHTSPSVYCDGKLSDAWDLYYRFDNTHVGENCPTAVSNGDCAPWGTPFQGGRDTQSSNFIDEVLFDSNYVIQSEGEYDSPGNLVRGGILLASTTPGSFSGLFLTNYDSHCDHPDYQIVEVAIFPKVFFCTDIVQVVTPMGQGKHFSANVYEGSNLGEEPDFLDCNPTIGPLASTQHCVYNTDKAPFGAVTQPGLETKNWSVMSNPYMWDSKEGVTGNQPLFYEKQNDSMFNGSQARMGQEWSWTVIEENLFGQYYNKWTFVESADVAEPGMTQVMGHYMEANEKTVAEGGDDPSITNIDINTLKPHVNQLLNLTFNTDVDRDHLPMTMFKVDWGDGTETSATGIEMRDRPETINPHSLYHIYGSADMDLSTAAIDNPTITITVRDNWGKQSTASKTITIEERR